MNLSEVTHALVQAGIDPAKTFLRYKGQLIPMALGAHPSLRAPTISDIDNLRSFGIPVEDLAPEANLYRLTEQVRSMNPKVGDLGCDGVDVEKWLNENRVKMFPGKVNRWVLARTLRDRPDTTDLQGTLVAVFNKWFGEDPLDPLFSSTLPPEDKRAGSTDGFKIIAAGPKRPSLSNTIQTREELPMLPIPTINPKGGVIFLSVEFNYRGLNRDRAWPVRTGGFVFTASQANCPVEADWMLTDVGSPDQDAPPKRDVPTIISEDVIKPVAKAAGSVLWWALGFSLILVGGAYIIKKQ